MNKGEIEGISSTVEKLGLSGMILSHGPAGAINNLTG